MLCIFMTATSLDPCPWPRCSLSHDLCNANTAVLRAKKSMDMKKYDRRS